MSGLIETRWDEGRIRVFLPRRTYRGETRLYLTRGEAEALVRNLKKRLDEQPAKSAAQASRGGRA